MEAKFSPRVKDLIRLSREEAVGLHNDFVSPEHLMLGLLKLNEGKAIQIIKEFQVDFSVLRAELVAILKKSTTSRKPLRNTTSAWKLTRNMFLPCTAKPNYTAVRKTMTKR